MTTLISALERIPADEFREDNVDPVLKSAVDIISDAESGEFIFNHDIVDAWYLVRRILLFADEKDLPVTIVSGHLRANFYNALLPALKQLVDKRRPRGVHVYLTETREPDTDYSEDGRNHFADVVQEQERKYPELYTLEYKPLEIPHIIFAGTGAEAFRIEKDPETKEALASFGLQAGKSVAKFVQEKIGACREP